MRATYLIALGALAVSTSAFVNIYEDGPPQILDNGYEETQ